MKVVRLATIASAMLLAGCYDSVKGPIGSTSGREKGTPSAAAGTPAQGGVPVTEQAKKAEAPQTH